MSVGTSDEVRFYINLLRNTLFASKHDLHKIPGPPGYRLLGNIPHLMRPDYHRAALEWADKYGGVAKFSLGGQWVVLVSDPALAARILGRGPGSLPRKCIGYSFFDMATNHLGLRSFFTTTDEDQWARIRKGTAAAFSHANIRRYFGCALKHAQELAGQVKMAAASNRGVVEVQEQVEMMLLDVFLEGLFEVDLRRVNSEEVGHAMNTVLEEANERIKMPLRKLVVPFLQPRWSWAVWRAQRRLGGLYERIHDTIRARGVPPDDETVLWACLARLRDPKTGRPLTKEQLLPEIGAFILAGFDTSSHTIAWCLFTIASHPEVQRRIKSELGTAGLLHQGQGNCTTPRQLSFEDLSRLTYLNAVIDETMRMYPVAATGSVRETTAPTAIGPYTVPEGIVVWPMIYALQNAAHNWEDPAEFKPERWLQGKDTAYFSAFPSAAAAPATGSAVRGNSAKGGAAATKRDAAAAPPAGNDAQSASAAAGGDGSPDTGPAGGGGAAGVGEAAAEDGAVDRSDGADSAGRGPRRFLPFSDGLKNCMGQALGLMEVRTVLVVLLSRFWFELAPSMGKPEAVQRAQQIALTLKIRGGLKLVCRPHSAAPAPATGGAVAKGGVSAWRTMERALSGVSAN